MPSSALRTREAIPLSTAAWTRRCAPLLDYLAERRTCTELRGWASARGTSQHRLQTMLSWLESEGTIVPFAVSERSPHA